MKSIKEKAKKWCSEHSNKGCTEQCDDCWLLKQAWGCEQYNMEMAFEAGATYVLEQIEQVVQGDLNSHSTFKLKCIKQIVEELKK